MHRVLVLHGPNLNALGDREPEVYGHASLADVEARLAGLAGSLDCRLEFLQSDHEGILIEALHTARRRAEGVLLNPGGLTHTSVALRDAVHAAGVPVIEVHLTNPHARESFRQHSLVSGAALGVIEGFGADSYLLALRAMAGVLSDGR
jgi:3-dehydroquinate dehydratase-2